MKIVIVLAVLCILLIGVCQSADCQINGAWRSVKDVKSTYRYGMLLSMFSRGTFVSLIDLGPIPGQVILID